MANFRLHCLFHKEEKEWDMSCKFKALSDKAKITFGDKILGEITFSYEPAVIRYLNNKFNVPLTTIILTFISRFDERIKGIGMQMLCSLIKDFKTLKHVTHIYLEVVESKKMYKLINLYKKFGFVSISESYPEKMIVSLQTLEKNCGKYDILTQFTPKKGSPEKKLN